MNLTTIPDILFRPVVDEFFTEMRSWQVEPSIGKAGQYTVTPVRFDHRRALKDAGRQWEWHFASMEEAARWVNVTCLHAALLKYDQIRPRDPMPN